MVKERKSSGLKAKLKSFICKGKSPSGILRI